MTLINEKQRNMTFLTGTILTVFMLSTQLPPAVADGPGYDFTGWFDVVGPPEVCYYESELDNMTVNGTTNNGDDIISTFNQTVVQVYNNTISGLEIFDDDGACSYNKIQVRSDSLPSGVMAQNTRIAYWVYPPNYDIAAMRITYSTNVNWEIDNDNCGVLADKDVEWIGLHEMGHALSLGHHANDPFDVNHSVMEPFCSSTWSAIQSDDITSLEVRYDQ